MWRIFNFQRTLTMNIKTILVAALWIILLGCFSSSLHAAGGGNSPITPVVAVLVNETAVQGDDIVAVSKAGDPSQNPTPLSPKVYTGIKLEWSEVSGNGYTVTLTKTSGANSGELSFENDSGTRVLLTTTESASLSMTNKTKIIKLWGKNVSSGKDAYTINVKFKKNSSTKHTMAENLTVIDGLQVAFSGKFYCPVNSVPENWRPTLLEPQAKAADVDDYSDRVSFTDPDQTPALTYRSHITQNAQKASTSVTTIRTIRPGSVEITDDPLKQAKLYVISGALVGTASQETFSGPHIEFKSGTKKFCSINLDAGQTATNVATTPNANQKLALDAKITTAATNGNHLAKWLLGLAPYNGNKVPDLEDRISRLRGTWSNDHMTTKDEADIMESISAKAILAAQEMRGSAKARLECVFEKYDAWDLMGEVNDGFLKTEYP